MEVLSEQSEITNEADKLNKEIELDIEGFTKKFLKQVKEKKEKRHRAGRSLTKATSQGDIDRN
jgi:hypothetical protein